MSNIIKIKIKFYGCFRKYGDFTDMVCPSGSSVSFIKKELIKLLGIQEENIINDSVLSDDRSILPDEYIVHQSGSLSILPPVCGG